MVRDVVRELMRVLKDDVVVGLEKETGKLPLKSTERGPLVSFSHPIITINLPRTRKINTSR